MGHCTVWAGPQHQGTGRWMRGGNPPNRSLSCKLETSGFSPASPFTQPYTSPSVFTARICPPRRLEKLLTKRTCFVFSSYCIWRRTRTHFHLHFLFNTFKKKKRKICRLWMKSSFNVSNLRWISTLARQRTRQGLGTSVETFFLSWNTFRNLLTFHLRPLCHCMQLILWTKAQISGATRSSACEPWVWGCLCVCDCWQERFIFVYYYYYSPQAVEANTSSRP